MQAIGAFDHDYQWLVDRVGCFIDPGFRAIKIVDEGGRIHGMVGYGAWTENSVMCHIALDNPAALRTMVTAGFKYPFEMAGRGVMLATVRASNVRSYRPTASRMASRWVRTSFSCRCGEKTAAS
jgi:hypothetical protein